jgi:hypothetical protein
MVGSHYRQKPSLPGKPNNVTDLISIEFTDNAGQEFGMSIVPEKIKAGKDRGKLIGTSNTFVCVANQGIEADREGYGEIVELLHKV